MTEESLEVRPRTRTIRKKKADTTELLTPNQEKDRLWASMLERRSRPWSMADRISGSAFHYKNYYYPHGKTQFPNEPKMQTVDKFYPFAEGGPLYVDEPQMSYEIERCVRKAPLMRMMKLRYVAILPNMTYEQAMLEAIK